MALVLDIPDARVQGRGDWLGRGLWGMDLGGNASDNLVRDEEVSFWNPFGADLMIVCEFFQHLKYRCTGWDEAESLDNSRGQLFMKKEQNFARKVQRRRDITVGDQHVSHSARDMEKREWRREEREEELWVDLGINNHDMICLWERISPSTLVSWSQPNPSH